MSISPQEVKQRLKANENGFILLDIREKKEYDDWNIKGSINIPINSFIASGNVSEARNAFSSLPADKEIVTVCARGINSQVAAELLTEMNYKAAYLEKGMKGWNENFDIYEIDFKDFAIVQFIRIGKGCLSYIVYSKKDKTAVIIDPSIFTYEYSNYVNEHHLKVKYVVDSHSHADHFTGGMELAKTLSINYYVNKIDVDSGFECESLDDIMILSLSNINIEILATPGHTDGSVSFLINNEALICGDLLLLESVGRPDLTRDKAATVKGAEKLYNTIQNIILKLDDNVKVFPAHFTRTELRPVVMTLKDLKAYNDSLTIKDKTDFISFITDNIPMTPPNYDAIKKYNKAGVIIPLDYAEDLEIGPNRCAAR